MYMRRSSEGRCTMAISRAHGSGGREYIDSISLIPDSLVERKQHVAAVEHNGSRAEPGR
jgi:hypothetical protein